MCIEEGQGECIAGRSHSLGRSRHPRANQPSRLPSIEATRTCALKPKAQDSPQHPDPVSDGLFWRDLSDWQTGMQGVRDHRPVSTDKMAESGVALIEDGPDNPFELFKAWYDEVKACGHLQPDAMSFSTATKEGVVSSRHVILRRLDADGIVIVTDRRSKKAKELKDNPKAAIAFLWIYMNGASKISRQVRLEGPVREMEPDEYVDIYNREPVFCKLRSHVCHQGQPTTWTEAKDVHDRLYDQYKRGDNPLPMPDHYIGYKITPTMFDFYHAHDNLFADRRCYLQEEDTWTSLRIAA